MTMLSVDVRGPTALGEAMCPAEFRALLSRFYGVATDVLTDSGAWLDKFVGDEAIGLFIPGFAGRDYAWLAVRAARDLLEATGHGSPEGPWIPLGVGIWTSGPSRSPSRASASPCPSTATAPITSSDCGAAVTPPPADSGDFVNPAQLAGPHGSSRVALAW